MKENFTHNEIREAIHENNEVVSNYDNTTDYELQWEARDRPLKEFGETFNNVLPKKYLKNNSSEAFKQYIEETLSNKNSRPLTAIEFGGPGSRLFRDFSMNFFHKTAGVCLDDIRLVDDTTDDVKRDEEHNHSVIQGNILDTHNIETKAAIANALGTNKADLIVSRMMAPLNEYNKHPAVLDKIIKKWYSLLNDNGLMFVQFQHFPEHNSSTTKKNVPNLTAKPIPETEQLVGAWAGQIQKFFPEIEIQLSRGIMRLHKKTGAPEKLPTIESFEDAE